MDRKKLKQYRALLKEIPMLEKKLDKLYEQEEKIPVVAGKVTKSSDDFPYIVEHVSVQMDEPKQKDEIDKQIRINEQRKKQCESLKTEIEQFIAGIEDSVDRQIFELMYMKGKKISQTKIGELLGYDQSTISLKINKYLKDS